MHDSRINYVVVGTFVTVMVVAFIVALTLLVGKTGARDTYYTIYNNVSDIKLGTPVMYEGYPIGQVDKVEPATPGGVDGKRLLFKVILKVQKGWRIPEDSLARAAASGLLSAMTIDIRGGDSTKMLAPGSQIPGASSSNFFATLTELSAQFGDISHESLQPMLRSLRDLIQHFDQVTKDSLPVIVKDVQSLTGTLAKEAPEIAASVKRLSNVLEKDLLKPENIQHIDKSLASLDETMGNLSKFTAELDQTRSALNDAMTTLNKVVQDNSGNISDSMRDLRFTLDTTARYIDEIVQNLASTARNMSEFSNSIRNNPGLLLGGATPPDEAAEAIKAKNKKK